MKSDSKVTEFLNIALKNELTAINQYFLHSALLDDWGISALAAFEKRSAIDEMHHAEWLIKRILLLEGKPNLQSLGRLRIGDDVETILRNDLELEIEAIELLRKAMAHCDQVHDYVSHDLFKRILASEEEHVDILETQLALIERTGVQNYIELRSHSDIGGQT